jgi:hypothetical protein
VIAHNDLDAQEIALRITRKRATFECWHLDELQAALRSIRTQEG